MLFYVVRNHRSALKCVCYCACFHSLLQSPGSASPSPPGAESSSQHLLQHDSFETSPTSKEVRSTLDYSFSSQLTQLTVNILLSFHLQSRRSLASFPTYVEGEFQIAPQLHDMRSFHMSVINGPD